MQPSPNDRRVGIRIVTFEACSGFTRVTARRIAQPPMATFVTRLRPRLCTTEPLVSYRTYRQLSGWNPPPLVIRAVRAHDHRENNECCVIAGEVLVVFDKPSATVKPAIGALNDPTLGQHVEPLCCVGALDDLERNSGLLFYIVGRRPALVTAIRDGLLERGEPFRRNGQERCDHVAILHVAR